MEHVSYFNVSPVQFFTSTEYDDIDVIETNHDSQDEVIDIIQPVQDIGNSKVNIECFDGRDDDILMSPQSSLKIKSKTLDICPNIPEIPTGRSH